MAGIGIGSSFQPALVPAVALVLISVIATGATAQERAEKRHDLTSVTQIAPILSTDPDDDIVQQVDTNTRSGPQAVVETQLGPQGRSADAGPQLVSGKPTAHAPTPLSRPEDGRAQQLVRVEGKDRCDTANDAARKNPDCAHVIETRSADYARPNPVTLSPEQRLLMYQGADEDGTGVSRAIRRVGSQSLDPNDPDAQSVASVVLPQDQTDQTASPDKKNPDTPSAADQLVVDILQAIAQQQGQQP